MRKRSRDSKVIFAAGDEKMASLNGVSFGTTILWSNFDDVEKKYGYYKTLFFEYTK